MKDAWLQHEELLEDFTQAWQVRSDLSVVAYAWDRCVMLGIDPVKDKDRLDARYTEVTTKRNVSTMRELAYCILIACDFVEGCNPEWAKTRAIVMPPDHFKVEH